MRPLAAALLAGSISRAEFIERAQQALRSGIASGARGEGASADDAASIADQLITERESYLADYADELDAADEDTGGGLLGRVALWAGLAWAGAMAGRVASADDEEAEFDWVCKEDRNSCDDCEANAEGGPYTADELPGYPGDGTTACNGNCRCELRETSGRSKRMNGLIYKQWRAETKLVNPKSHEYFVRMAVSGDDRDDDIIDHKGWILDHFNAHPVLVSSHVYEDLRKQIGEWRDLDVSKGDLRGIAKYYAGEGNDEADWGANLASKGRAAYSVGFIPYEWEPRKGHSGQHFTKQELLETSHVIIPSGREALQLMAKGVTADPHGLRAQLAREALAEMDKQPRRSWRGFTPQRKAEMGGDEQTCVQMAQDILDRLNQLILHEAQEQVAGEDEDDDIRLLLACRDMIQQFQQRELLGDTGDAGYYGGYYLSAGAALLKAGRVISSANMGKLHAAMDNLHAVHDGACNDDACEYNSGGDGDTKRAKAMGEGDGSAGGVTVSDSGTHGAFDGKHSHSHDAGGHTSSADDAGMHEHQHSHDGDGNHGHSHDGVNFKTAREREITRAEQSAASQNDLPDSAFAVISAGGEKDADGKTTPRSLRHLPHHKADGSIDLPHLKTWKNALARVSQTDLSDADRAKAEKHLEAHAKAEKIGEYADDSKSFDLDAALDAVLAGVEL